jgi:hypothetical protein
MMTGRQLLLHIREHLTHAISDAHTVSGIFCHPPEDASYPYITLEREETKAHLARLGLRFSLKIWSLYKGVIEIERLATHLQAALHGLPAPRHSHLSIKALDQQLSLDGQGVRSLTLRYQAHLRGKVVPFPTGGES